MVASVDLIMVMAYHSIRVLTLIGIEQDRDVVNKKLIQKIGEKEMDRKEFLKYSGVVLLSIVGLRSIANVILDEKNTKIIVKDDGPRGFGSGKYGC